MKELGTPEILMSIVVRPCYDKEGQVSSDRYIGEIFVLGKSVYQTSDLDVPHAALNKCAKHMDWYKNKFGVNFIIDAKMGRLKK